MCICKNINILCFICKATLQRSETEGIMTLVVFYVLSALTIFLMSVCITWPETYKESKLLQLACWMTAAPMIGFTQAIISYPLSELNVAWRAIDYVYFAMMLIVSGDNVGLRRTQEEDTTVRRFVMCELTSAASPSGSRASLTHKKTTEYLGRFLFLII